MVGDRKGTCLVHGIYLYEDVLMQLSTMHTEHTMKIVLNYDNQLYDILAQDQMTRNCFIILTYFENEADQ